MKKLESLEIRALLSAYDAIEQPQIDDADAAVEQFENGFSCEATVLIGNDAQEYDANMEPMVIELFEGEQTDIVEANLYAEEAASVNEPISAYNYYKDGAALASNNEQLLSDLDSIECVPQEENLGYQFEQDLSTPDPLPLAIEIPTKLYAMDIVSDNNNDANINTQNTPESNRNGKIVTEEVSSGYSLENWLNTVVTLANAAAGAFITYKATMHGMEIIRATPTMALLVSLEASIAGSIFTYDLSNKILTLLSAYDDINPSFGKLKQPQADDRDSVGEQLKDQNGQAWHPATSLPVATKGFISSTSDAKAPTGEISSGYSFMEQLDAGVTLANTVAGAVVSFMAVNHRMKIDHATPRMALLASLEAFIAGGLFTYTLSKHHSIITTILITAAFYADSQYLAPKVTTVAK